MQQATGIVVKPYHEIKIIHIQARVPVQKSDILDDLIQLFEMLPKDRGRYFFLSGISSSSRILSSIRSSVPSPPFVTLYFHAGKAADPGCPIWTR